MVEQTRTQPVAELLGTATGEPCPQLVLVMNGATPLEPSVRVLLDDFQEVTVGRGTPQGVVVDRQKGKQRLRINLDDDFVSTRHARFFRANGGWWYEDMGSKNGTYLDGTRVERSSLSDQALVEIGRSVFLFRLAPTSDRTPIVQDHELAAPFSQLRTFSSALASQVAKLAAVASSGISVLALGETGTGKGILAKALHEASGRSPFVVVNLATIPENLLSTELFGHRKGAFSGAVQDHKGLVRTADGGTLFLDELGDLPPSAQQSLLLVLQDREVRPIGYTAPVPVNLRVVAATNRDLMSMVERGEFRRDLFTRLEGLTVRLPRLSDRREDLGLLIRNIIRREASTPGRVNFSNLVTRALMLYDWPGNIRELEKVIQAAITLAKGSTIDTTHLPVTIRRCLSESVEGGPTSREADVAPFDLENRDALLDVLRRHGGNVSAAARSLGLRRQLLFKWIKTHAIEVDALRF